MGISFLSLEKWSCLAKAFHKWRKAELRNVGSDGCSLVKSWTREGVESRSCCGHCFPGEASTAHGCCSCQPGTAPLISASYFSSSLYFCSFTFGLEQPG